MQRRGLIWIGVAVVLVAVLGLFAWPRIGAWRVWMASRNLQQATPETLQQTLDQFQADEAQTIPLLVRQLSSRNAELCVSTGIALGGLLERKRAEPERWQELLQQLAAEFPNCSAAGQGQALVLWHRELTHAGDTVPAAIWQTATLMVQVANGDGEGSRLPALRLAHLLAESEVADQVRDTCRRLAAAALDSQQVEERVMGVKLAAHAFAHAGMESPASIPATGAAHPTKSLLERLPAMIAEPGDPAAEVRYVVMLALGNQEELLPSDLLVPRLHDSDENVAALAERILRARGLAGEPLRLAKMVASPDAAVRAKVAEAVLEVSEVDAGVWLERLSRDEDPAVRAAVVRVVATGEPQTKWQAWVRERANRDPSPTVQAIAQFYMRTEPTEPR